MANDPGLRTWRLRIAITGVAAILLTISACPDRTGDVFTTENDRRMPQLSAKEISVPWRLVSSRDATLRVEMLAGGCFALDRVEANESTPGEIFIIAIDRDISRPGVICTTNLDAAEREVTLKSPRAGRRLIHAPISPAWNGPQKVGE